MQLFGPGKNKLELLKKYKDYCIESVLSTGDKTLSILHPANLSKNIVEEGYIQNKTDEYVIKEIVTQGNWKRVKAKLNVEDLEGKVFESFETVAETITDCVNLALAGTGWTVGTCNVTKRRTVRKTNSSSWDIIQEAKKVYRCELEFETLKKKINIYEKRGADKGVYFIDTLNLKSLDVQSDSYDYYTKIIAKGKGDLKVTLENFQYSNKVKTYIWKDERYTDIDSLTEDATAKLNDLSKPYRSYKATIIDLANISKENYKNILSYSLGDIITLVSKENKIREKQRIVKITEYPDEPQRNTCEMANTILTFEDIQKELQETSNTVNNITTDNGTIDGSAINSITTNQISDFKASIGEITDLTVVNARIDELYAKKANISELNAVVANVGELYATKATITELNVLSANINTALIGKADITELNALNATIKVLEADTATIKTLVNGNLSSENIQAGGITSDRLTIANGFIVNAMIANLDVSKINAGNISTNKFRIVSDDGGIEIVGATQQFKDKNNKVRIQMGQDTKGNFNFILRGEDGTTTLIDHTGIKENAIADDLIKENMVAADSIGEKQINYSSLITGLNKDNNTQLIKASKVAIDFVGQSLEVAFNSLKSNVDNIEIGGRNLLRNGLLKGISFPYSGSEYNWRTASINDGNGLTRTKVEINDCNAFLKTVNGIKITNSSNDNVNGAIAQDNVKMEHGETYTMSAYFKLIKGSVDGVLQYGTSPYFSKKFSLANEWKKYSFTFTYDKNRFENKLTTNIYFCIRGANFEGYICGFKLEKGTKATDYTDAIDDVDSSIESVKQITESNSTTINVMQGKIATAINNTQIVKDGQTILLKDDYNRTVSKVNSINSTIGTHATKIDQLTGNITNVDTKVNSVQRDLEGTKSTVSSHTSQINGLNSTVSTQGSSINQLKNQITLKVEQTDINNAINNIKVGGRNYVKDYKFKKDNVWNKSRTEAKINTSEGYGYLTSSTVNPFLYQRFKENEFKIGDTITIQYEMKCSNVSANTGNDSFLIRVQLTGYDSNNSHVRDVAIFGKHENDYLQYSNWTKVVKTLTLSGENDFSSTALRLYARNFKGTVYFRNVKLEKGSKATDLSSAQEDVDSAISNVDSKITTTNNKVATIETNLNSITQRVSSTESTVSTHTTQLGTVDSIINTAKNSAISTASNDATTKANNAKTNAINSAKAYTDGQIKTVNQTITNKVAEIKTTTDSITQKVTSTESKITTINSNISSLQNRISSAESKITDSAIINTVKNTITSAKNEAINSANSTTDNKLKNYATKSSLIQTEKNITAKFEESGGYNIVENSTGYNMITNGWANTGNDSSKIKAYYNASAKLKTGYYLSLHRDNETTTNANAAVSRRFKLKPNTTYTISGILLSNSKTLGIRFMVKTSNDIEFTEAENRKDFNKVYTVFSGKVTTWTKKTLTFTTDSNVKSGCAYIDHLGYDASDTGTSTNRVYWSEICLVEGDIQLDWSPHPNEVYSGSTIIDASGVTVNNGALRVKNNAGTTVLEGDSNGNLTMKNGCFKVLSSNNMEIASINQNNWMRLQGLELFGAGECMQNKGSGVRSMKLISTDGKASHIDFNENASVNYTVRLIKEANSKSLMLLGNGMTFMPNTANTACGLEIRSQANTAFIDFTANQSDDYHARLYIKNNDKTLYTAGAGLKVQGALSVTGSKNCLQETESYGGRLINAYETAEYYFGDLGFGKINKDGECLIYIDDIFAECINTNVEYHVFTQTYNGLIKTIDRYKTYFIVKGDPGTNFSWELKSKRKGYENNRLDIEDIDNFTVDGIKTFKNEDFMIETAEESLLDILTFELENILMEG